MTVSDLYKEYCKATNECTIRTDSCEDSVAHIEDLFKQAVADFPKLKKSEVTVVIFDNYRRHRSYGIAFKAPRKPSKAYGRVDEHRYHFR